MKYMQAEYLVGREEKNEGEREYRDRKARKDKQDLKVFVRTILV